MGSIETEVILSTVSPSLRITRDEALKEGANKDHNYVSVLQSWQLNKSW